MSTTLAGVIQELGIPTKPRYSLEEVADVLGIRRDQVVDLIRKGKLPGMKSSMNRWRGVFASDLDAFIQKVNAPRPTVSKTPDTSHQPGAPQLGPLKVPAAGSTHMPSAEQGAIPWKADPVLSMDAGLPVPPLAMDPPTKPTKRVLDLDI